MLRAKFWTRHSLFGIVAVRQSFWKPPRCSGLFWILEARVQSPWWNFPGIILPRSVGSFSTVKLFQAWMPLGSLSGAGQHFSQKTRLGSSSATTQLDIMDRGIRDRRQTYCSPPFLVATCLSVRGAQGLCTSGLLPIDDLGCPIYRPLSESAKWGEGL